MYTYVRIILGFLVLWILIFRRRKNQTMQTRRRRAAAIVFLIIAITASALIPIENLFLTFNSPQEAYAYMYTQKPSSILVVDGQSCDFIIGKESDTNTHVIFPKTDDGWKIETGFAVNDVANVYADGVYIYIYQYKNTKDYFVCVYDPEGIIISLHDNMNSNFLLSEEKYMIQPVNGDSSIEKTAATYYASIPNVDAGYCLAVNDTQWSPMANQKATAF